MNSTGTSATARIAVTGPCVALNGAATDGQSTTVMIANAAARAAYRTGSGILTMRASCLTVSNNTVCSEELQAKWGYDLAQVDRPGLGDLCLWQ